MIEFTEDQMMGEDALTNFWIVRVTGVRPSTTFLVEADNYDKALCKALAGTPHSFCIDRLTREQLSVFDIPAAI